MCERGGLIAKDDYAAFSQPPPLPWHRRDSRRITAAPPRTLLHCRQQSTEPASERESKSRPSILHALPARHRGVAGCTDFASRPKICRYILLCARQMSPRKAFDFSARGREKIFNCSMPRRRALSSPQKHPTETAQINGRIAMQMKWRLLWRIKCLLLALLSRNSPIVAQLQTYYLWI